MLFPKYLAIKVNNVLLQQKKMIGRVELSNLEYKVHLKRSMQYKKIYQTEIILKVCIGKIHLFRQIFEESFIKKF